MPIELLLVLALPASGKSEVRRYLATIPPQVARSDFHLGPTVQIDDYPYVHLMRRISEEQRRLGVQTSFFASREDPFLDTHDWLTLTHLIRDDVLSLGRPNHHTAASILDRLASARIEAGCTVPEIHGGAALREAVAEDAAAVAAGIPTPATDDLNGATIVVEFARGGPHGATMPLPHPLGYRASLAALGPEILERAAILHVWVEPGESRRRNRERALPGREGDASILHHGVPEAVMLREYGTDDLAWLEEVSPVPGTAQVETGAVDTLVPIAHFDNRQDRTSFLRADPVEWPGDQVARLHRDLAAAFALLGDG